MNLIENFICTTCYLLKSIQFLYVRAFASMNCTYEAAKKFVYRFIHEKMIDLKHRI